MAKSNMFVPLFFMILSLVLFINLAESKFTFPESPSPSPSPSPTRELTCLKVVNVKDGDTCFDISKTFGLAIDVFNAFNPNLNCTALFVGQLLCVDGTFS
ncbi:hypothetical protein K7X08_033354 [Anisodus acutangulus]|uniref:LysM domain-containing protein n=1 Tax=Anisodus acutangulus TaxID=402998 RepID=A0A9Q1RD53_9SOLA|nr:hypothetical protein K7X08_033354 [Anisodus acutangulus]